MVNPFDRNFFKFFIGFIFVLLTSFTILYFIGRYGRPVVHESVTAVKGSFRK